MNNDPIPYTSKETNIACNSCESHDAHTKLVCAKCKRWWHLKCDGREAPSRSTVTKGMWVCEACSKPEEMKDITENDITRVNLSDAGLLNQDVVPLIDNNSTTKKPPSKAPSKRSSKSHLSQTSQEKINAINQDLELAKRQLEIEAEMKRLEVEKRDIEHTRKGRNGKSCSSSSDTVFGPEGVDVVDDRRESVDKCNAWLKRDKAGSRIGRQHQSRRNEISFLNPVIGLEDFVNETLHAPMSSDVMNLTRAQVNARHVVSKDLPLFNGDPKDWPAFITKLRDTTRLCGITAAENLERLGRCLKGQALEAVQSDLNNPEALPNVLSTLKLLFGRPEVIYNSLIDQVRSVPVVKMEKLQTVVTYAMKIKTLCDTLKSADMHDYLMNPPLLTELVERLPTALQLRWGDYNDTMRVERIKVDLEAFSMWLRREVEKVSRVSGQLFTKEAPNTQYKGGKSKKSDNFQGSHQTEATDDEYHNVHSTGTKNDKHKQDDTTQNAQQVEDKDEYSNCKFCHEGGHVTCACTKFKELSVAQRWGAARRKFMCIRCLGKHMIKNCGSMVKCKIDGCVELHHPLLHSGKPRNTNETEHDKATINLHEDKPTDNSTVDQPTASTSNNANLLMHANEGAKFQIVPVILSNGEVEIRTYAFLDSGSNITIVESKLMKQLGVSGPTRSLKLKWSNDISRVEHQSQSVRFSISNIEGNYTTSLQNVRTVAKLQLPMQSMSLADLQKYKHLKNIPVSEYANAQPQILIGIDNHTLMVPMDIVEGHEGEPVAIKTRLGWTVFGSGENSEYSEKLVNSHIANEIELHKLVEKYFTLENIGVKVPKQLTESNQDARARQIMEQTIQQHPDGKYEIGLLWKCNTVSLPDSYKMALNRLKCFENRLRRHPELRSSVNAQINEYHENGYLEELSIEQQRSIRHRKWYLPIFVVTNPNKPGKERLVWDAAAKVQGESLNDHLLTGPDLAANLVGILFKFREKRYAIGGDIKQMFHQIRIRERDQDVQRCLWREDERGPIRTSKMTVATFGAACSPSIAQFVKNYNAKKFETIHPRAVDAIIHRHYVDDYVDSYDSWEEGKEIAEQVFYIHDQGGFYIRNFVANDIRMLSELPKDEEKTERLIETSPQSTKILGMWWDTTNDVLRFKVNEERIGHDLLEGSITPTKRIVLRIVMMVFDPLGLLGFLILRGKLTIKAIWRTKVDWDEMIQPEEMELWKQWLGELRHIPEVEIERWYFTESNVESYELHVFVDAGEEAAAAVAYAVRCLGEKREPALISSKSKVAPNRCISIPRMELQAAIIGVRLASFIKESHSIVFKSCVFWTDSRNVLCWLRSPQRFKIFVAHRVSEIREETSTADWKWVPSKLNPADHITKWKQREENVPTNWFSGPKFLTEDVSQWPTEPDNLPPITDDILEVRCNFHVKYERESLCVNIERFSSINRLVRCQARILKFFYRKKPFRMVSVEDLEDARKYVTREVQQQVFANDYRCLKDGKTIPKNSQLKRYSPFLDPEGIIRMRSRLQEAEYLSAEQRNPIILPSKHHFTFLIVTEIHQKYWHQNFATVLNEVRQTYMIPAIRSILRSVRHRCQVCKILRARPEIPEMSALPRSRLAARIKPFSYVGIDCFGPMMIKVGRRREKRWGVLFTCLTTRALHIEITSAMSSDAFILSFRCFVGRRGEPLEVFCDNGTNFRGADTELKRALEDNVKKAIEDRYTRVKFNFNPPSAPHMGGAWERLVRSVKVGLRCTIGDQTLNEETLRATLIEIEMVINSRPLTYVQTDENSHEALTPNHFLLGHSSGVKPIGNMTDDPEILKKEWKRQQLLLQHFWQRWTNEYLPEIARRTKWFDQAKQLQIGDVVAVVNSTIPYSWQLGRVIEITQSKDGNVRQARIQTSTGILRRPASKLAVLERETEDQKD